MARNEQQENPQEIVYREEQRFTQWFIWVFLIGLCSIPVYGIIQQVILDKTIGSKPMSDTGLFIFLLFSLGFCYFFRILKLQTTVTREHIWIRLSPLAKKKILWKDVAKAEIVQYSPWIGYGLRLSPSYGTVYNIKGNKGLLLVLRNGKKVMVGTQRSRELEEVSRMAVKSL
jgi:hypothetical protein